MGRGGGIFSAQLRGARAPWQCLLHADTHKQIARALTTTHTLNAACALLARQASAGKRR